MDSGFNENGDEDDGGDLAKEDRKNLPADNDKNKDLNKAGAQQNITNGSVPKLGIVTHQASDTLDIGAEKKPVVVLSVPDVELGAATHKVTLAVLVAIPEVVASDLHRSKQRANNNDEVVMNHSSKLKAIKDVDVKHFEGANPKAFSFLHFPDEIIHSSFSIIGIILGNDDTTIRDSVIDMTKVEENKFHETRITYWKSDVIDKGRGGGGRRSRHIHIKLFMRSNYG